MSEAVHPNDGGCWFCHGADGEMVFSVEFDTYLHMACLVNENKHWPDDHEVRIMARELLD